ncbi:MAG: ArsJ-associated glyceraldehyde-3-phosphate dehydrogenase [Pseudomonadales bacterium]|nr:ArsJ-associated glyceraldehyde-3-phosphate dehydrogenase [Pseudomonadales bacterium]NRA16502.1 ArsJ-associated glyceraldehyde-3-phosphate dehydrogenase [Oceanospirillaceae bacterium]
MSIKVAINGFGRMGRLALRAAWNSPELEFVQINESAADAQVLAHLLNFDSVHGRWHYQAEHNNSGISIENQQIICSQNQQISATDWSGCDLVIDATGVHKSAQSLQPYFEQGVKKVLVTAPVKDPAVANIVMGVNQQTYNAQRHNIVTAASCTTNCIAPVVKVLQEKLGIIHGSFTTIHNITNTQSILDVPRSDLRRSRACGQSLIPTTTGSATAITQIFPELQGKINGHAVRVPLANASLTDCVFEVARNTSVDEINTLLAEAAAGELQGILGFEKRPLVSVDYKTDPRSVIVDGLSTMVINDTHVKLYLWYDNEWGYANRVVDLAKFIGE